MKQPKRFIPRIIPFLLTVLLLAAAALPGVALLDSGTDVLPASGAASFTKTAYAGKAVTFSAKDFESLSTGGALDSIIITSLPAVTDGTLAFAGERILTGSSISANALAGLTFYPAAGLSDSTATFSFVPVYADGSSPSQPLTVNIRMSSAKNSAPVAENITLSTYKNVSLTGEFSAVDPEGDALTFRIMDKPARGSVEIAEDGSNKFVYTPYPNKTGNDIFTYVAVDASGKESAAAKVKISIEKPKTKVNYSDMEDNSANRASIKLAEKGVFIGEQVGASYFFRPDQPVTRSTFVAMALTAAGINDLSSVTRTGFADDADIPAWARPYVSTALKNGVIRGMPNENGQVIFNPNAIITRAEAAVVLNKVLQISDVNSTAVYDESDVPAWAYQAAVNLETCGVLNADSTGALRLSAGLSRAEAADMLCAALEIIEARENATGWFNW